MNEPAPPSPTSTAGRRAFVFGIGGFVLFLTGWWLVEECVPFFVAANKVQPVIDAIDTVGAICVVIGLGLGFNYVTWKYVESRWLRWVVFGLEGTIGALILYALWTSRGT